MAALNRGESSFPPAANRSLPFTCPVTSQHHRKPNILGEGQESYSYRTFVLAAANNRIPPVHSYPRATHATCATPRGLASPLFTIAPKYPPGLFPRSPSNDGAGFQAHQPAVLLQKSDGLSGL